MDQPSQSEGDSRMEQPEGCPRCLLESFLMATVRPSPGGFT